MNALLQLRRRGGLSNPQLAADRLLVKAGAPKGQKALMLPVTGGTDKGDE